MSLRASKTEKSSGGLAVATAPSSALQQSKWQTASQMNKTKIYTVYTSKFQGAQVSIHE